MFYPKYKISANFQSSILSLLCPIACQALEEALEKQKAMAQAKLAARREAQHNRDYEQGATAEILKMAERQASMIKEKSDLEQQRQGDLVCVIPCLCARLSKGIRSIVVFVTAKSYKDFLIPRVIGQHHLMRFEVTSSSW